jgi:hypothetical protein
MDSVQHQSGSEAKENKLKVRLANAGFTSPDALHQYLGIKAGTMVCGASIGTAYGLGVYGVSQRSLIILLFGGGLGFYLPELILSLMIRGWVGGILMIAVPAALFFAVSCWNPDYVTLLFAEESVRIIIAAAAVLHLLGAVAIKKVMKVKV